MTDKEREYWKRHIKAVDERNKQLRQENQQLKLLKFDLDHCESLKNRLIQELNLIKANSILKKSE